MVKLLRQERRTRFISTCGFSNGKTARCVLAYWTRNEGPVCDLNFQKTGGMLASDSRDGTMKLWDLYKGNVPSENAQHASHVVCVAF